MRKKNWLMSIIPAAIVYTMTAAHGASLVKMNFQEIVQDADLIVVAQPVTQKMMSNGTAKLIQTEFEVSETIMGNSYPSITVQRLGMIPTNMDQKTISIVPGATQYFNNQKSVLFLKKMKNTNDWVLVGSSQGSLSLTETADGSMTINGVASDMSMNDMRAQISQIRQSVK